MKKITFGLFSLLFYWNSPAAIVVRDINDVVLTLGVGVDLDFNNDATTEFRIENISNSVGSFYDPNTTNFYGTGTLNSGHGWDVMKALTINTSISSTSVFDGQGDAYIDPSWANPNELFPQGDSYVGCKFKLSNNWYYGWILVNKNATTITLKSYAYNNVAGQSIIAGQTVLSTEKFEVVENQLYPNPTKSSIYSNFNSSIKHAYVTDVLGKRFPVSFEEARIDLEPLQKGVYILEITYDQNKISYSKIIKE